MKSKTKSVLNTDPFSPRTKNWLIVISRHDKWQYNNRYKWPYKWATGLSFRPIYIYIYIAPLIAGFWVHLELEGCLDMSKDIPKQKHFSMQTSKQLPLTTSSTFFTMRNSSTATRFHLLFSATAALACTCFSDFFASVDVLPNQWGPFFHGRFPKQG